MARIGLSLCTDTRGTTQGIEMFMLAGFAVATGAVLLGPFATHITSRFVETEEAPPSLGSEHVSSGPWESEVESGEDSRTPSTPWDAWRKAKLILWATTAALPDHWASAIAQRIGDDPSDVENLLRFRAPLAAHVGTLHAQAASGVKTLLDAAPGLGAYAKEHPVDALTNVAFFVVAGNAMDAIETFSHVSALAFASNEDELQQEIKVLTNGIALAAIMHAGGKAVPKRKVRELSFNDNLHVEAWSDFVARTKAITNGTLGQRPPFRGTLSIDKFELEKSSSTVIANWVHDHDGNYVIDAAALLRPQQDSLRMKFIGYFDEDAGRALIARAAARSKWIRDFAHDGRLTVQADDAPTNAFLRDLGFVPLVPELGSQSVLALASDTANALIRGKPPTRPNLNEWTHGIGLAERQATRIAQLSPRLREDVGTAINDYSSGPLRIEYVHDYDGPMVVQEKPLGRIKINPEMVLTEDELLLGMAREVGEIRSGKRALDATHLPPADWLELDRASTRGPELVASAVQREIEANAQTIFYYLQRRDELHHLVGRDLPNQFPDYQPLYEKFKHDDAQAVSELGALWSSQGLSDGRTNISALQNRYELLWESRHDERLAVDAWDQSIRTSNLRRMLDTSAPYEIPRTPDRNVSRPAEDSRNTRRENGAAEPPLLN